MGVSRGNKSFIGGLILGMPMTFTIAFNAPKTEPKTSGYSSPNYSYKIIPSLLIKPSSPHVFITKATL
jgi:hypothetical protein